MHVLALPNEILQPTLSFLLVPSLVKVSLVCKRFCSLAQPLIFRSIKLWLILIAEPDSLKNYGTIGDYHNLVQLFSNGSSLQGNVQSLSIDAYEKMSTYAYDVDVNHLIRLLPRLRFLHLAPPPTVLNVSGNLVLKTIELEFGGSSHDVSRRRRSQPTLGTLSELFWSPSLQTLKAHCIRLSNPHGSRFFPRYRYRTSQITNLSLKIEECRTVGALPELLMAIKALQNLVLNNECFRGARNIATPGLSARSIRESISHHAASMIHLVIACSDAATFLPIRPSFGSYVTTRHTKAGDVVTPLFC